ncbi:hypothetical protein T484DRAFT_1788660 [Baffinella frigidus]|nr:hypothetical protein T484DRAFT_1788660 [Cryptophyta sp. CCMP2293]
MVEGGEVDRVDLEALQKRNDQLNERRRAIMLISNLPNLKGFHTLNERRRAIMLISNLPNLKNAKLECIKQLTSNLRNVRKFEDTPRFEDIPVHEAGAKGDYMFLVEAGAVTVSVGGEQEEGQELLNAQKPKAGGGQLEKTRYVYDEARPRSAGSDGVMEEHEDPELAALADDLPGLYRLSKADFLRLSTKFPELKTALVLTDQERQER